MTQANFSPTHLFELAELSVSRRFKTLRARAQNQEPLSEEDMKWLVREALWLMREGHLAAVGMGLSQGLGAGLDERPETNVGGLV